MARFDKIQWEPVPERQKEHFLQWIREWNIDLVLREEDSNLEVGDELGAVRSGDQFTCANFDLEIRAGQIRLLPRSKLPEESGMVFLAVLAVWPGTENQSNPSYLIAPFSRFSVPASNHELAIPVENEHFRALSIWNSRTVGGDLLEETWIVGDITESDRRDAFELFKNFSFGRKLPERLRNRIGPPIALLEDPRLQYQKEESERLWHFSDFAEKTSEGRSEGGESSPRLRLIPEPADIKAFRSLRRAIPWDSEIVGLAASDRSRQKKHLPKVGFKETQLALRISIYGKSIVLNVVDDSVPVDNLDGAFLRDEDGRESERIKGGQLLISDPSLLASENLQLILDDDEKTVIDL